MTDQHSRVCIIGAGAAGLTAARHLKARGIPFDVIEKYGEVGGIWNYGREDSPLYASTKFISSKKLSQYPDFPMPRNYPQYINRQQALDYLHAYTEHFELREHIRFNTAVEKVARLNEGGWQVTFDTGESELYSALIVATGHLNIPKYPDIPGEFSGESMHSFDYDTSDMFGGKRVLVVGAGNSGCDIAVELSRFASVLFHSTRRGYYYVPRMIFGTPSDVSGEMMLQAGLPPAVRRVLQKTLLRLVQPNPVALGLPRPDHEILESHPIINGRILSAIKRGEIIPMPDVVALHGDEVEFANGTREAVDHIIYATGYRMVISFIDDAHLNWQEHRPGFYLHMFHPQYEDLFLMGFVQPDSGSWWVYHYQADAIAAYLSAAPEQRQAFDQEKAGPQPDLGAGRQYVHSERHALELEHFSYTRRLKRIIKQLS